MPRAVVLRAGEVLRELELEAGSPERRRERTNAVSQPATGPLQLTLFGTTHPAVERLRALEVDSLSPLDALQALYELARIARE
jgi:DNA mismatch repair protein MutS